MQALYYELPYKNCAFILHLPIHAICPSISYFMTCPHQYTAKVDIMTDRCTTRPFPIYLLLLVLTDAMLFFISPLSDTLDHITTELRILCVSPARSV